MLPPLEDDPRLKSAIRHFNLREYEEASDLMEDLFFESVGKERPVARVLLQLCVGMVHVEQSQHAPALERLQVGLDVARDVRDWLGLDGDELVRNLESAVRQLATRRTVDRFDVRQAGSRRIR